MYAFPSSGAKRPVSPEECTDQPAWMTFFPHAAAANNGSCRVDRSARAVREEQVDETVRLQGHRFALLMDLRSLAALVVKHLHVRGIAGLAVVPHRSQKRPQSPPLRDFGPSPVSKTPPYAAAAGPLAPLRTIRGVLFAFVNSSFPLRTAKSRRAKGRT